MSDFDEAQRKAEQFAIYWYGERATLTRMEQHDPIALTPLAPSEPLEPTAGDAPASDEQGVDAYAWTAIVHPPQGFAVRITVLRTPSGWYGFPVGQVGE
ncbi:MAG TPA: hypothetical protein VGS80_23670 [Ktedonobacterales bacterium]|nr:hypothetical protein [Ktedonobacterales bacterium]